MTDHVVEGTEPRPVDPMVSTRRKLLIAVVITVATIALLFLVMSQLAFADPSGGCGGG